MKKMSSRHRLILYRVIQGQTQREIAEELGYSLDHLGKLIRSPLFKSELAKAQEKVDERVKERITNASELGMELLEDILVNDKVDLRLRAATAEKMLDRAGHGAKQNVSVQHNVINLIEEAYSEKLKSADRMLDDGDVIDAEVVSDS